MSIRTEHSLQWNVEQLYHELAPRLPNLSIEVVSQIASTNTALLERARVATRLSSEGDLAQVRRSTESQAFGRRTADHQPCLLVAEHQTEGRGRQGRVWHSEAGVSLTFSLGVPLAPVDWSGFSLAVGVGDRGCARSLGWGPPTGRPPPGSASSGRTICG